MAGLIVGGVIGFLVLGPIGAVRGILVAGFLYLKPADPRPPRRLGYGRPPGHSDQCGCKKCYRADGLL